MTLDDLLKRADEALDETVALLVDLVRIPTVNSGPQSPANESELCRFLAAKLARDGIECQVLC